MRFLVSPFSHTFITDRLFHRFLQKSSYLSEISVYRVVLAAESDNRGLDIQIRLKTDNPVIFEIVGFSSDIVLMVKNEFYDLQLVPSVSFSAL